MDILNAQAAEKLVADEFLASSNHDFVVQPDKTVPKPFGWVIFYTTRAFLQTRDRRAMVPGAGPVAVMRNGEIVPLATSLPPALAIEKFEKEWLEASEHVRKRLR